MSENKVVLATDQTVFKERVVNNIPPGAFINFKYKHFQLTVFVKIIPSTYTERSTCKRKKH